MLGYEKEQRSLTKQQKEAIGLLSLGTFLEYFDLMLYVHMAVLLNELFYPKADARATALYTAAAFCSTYLLRPIGALVFGWIGDNIGRKATVIITTGMMAISCIVMATFPTYAQMGVTAAWVVTICRIVQGISCMGEVIGAELYITEITKPPIQYPAVTIVSVFTAFGGFAALAIAYFATKHALNWRIAFWIGGIIAVVGIAARTRLRETPEFVDAKRQLKKNLEPALEVVNVNKKELERTFIWNEKVNKKTSWALFLIQCSWPVCFYIIYFHCGNILKNSFGYDTEQVIHQNLIVAIFQILSFIIWGYLSWYIYPLILLKIKIFAVLIFSFPFLLNNITSPFSLLIIQVILIMFSLNFSPAIPIFLKHFPVFKRFTYASLLYALSRTFMSIITSFGLVYFTDYFGHWGISIITVPVVIGFIWSISHFQKLEEVAGTYPKKKKYTALALQAEA